MKPEEITQAFSALRGVHVQAYPTPHNVDLAIDLASGESIAASIVAQSDLEDLVDYVDAVNNGHAPSRRLRVRVKHN